MAQGIDYSSGHPRASAVKAAGFSAVLRYLSYTPAKNLSRAEATEMIGAGVDICAVWETTAQRVLSGAQGGNSDGAAAKRQYEACGAPVIAAIYYAVDFDAQPAQYAAIQAYQDAFKAAIAPHPVGVYGSYAVCSHFLDHGATFAWQTMAWSKGKKLTTAHIFQRIGQVTVDGVQCDVDDLTPPYGGWFSAPVPQPPPQPPASVHLTILGVPMARIPVTIPTDPNGDGDAFICAADKFGAISGSGIHDKYDPATHDTDTIVVPVGARDDGDHFTAVVAKGPANASITTWALIAD